MNNKKKLLKYANSFIKLISPYLKKGFYVSAKVFPAAQEGAVIEFIIDESKKGVTLQQVSPSVNKILAKVEQRLIGGNVEGVKFGGTSISIEDQRIVLIKGEDSHDSWSNAAVEEDVKKVVSPDRWAR